MGEVEAGLRGGGGGLASPQVLEISPRRAPVATAAARPSVPQCLSAVTDP